MVYDFPQKRTDRNHLVKSGALLFMKSKIGWRIAGVVHRVQSMGLYPESQQKFAQLLVRKMEPEFYSIGFATKNAAVEYLGFKSLSENERMFGLIPLYRQ